MHSKFGTGGRLRVFWTAPYYSWLKFYLRGNPKIDGEKQIFSSFIGFFSYWLSEALIFHSTRKWKFIVLLLIDGDDIENLFLYIMFTCVRKYFSPLDNGFLTY